MLVTCLQREGHVIHMQKRRFPGSFRVFFLNQPQAILHVWFQQTGVRSQERSSGPGVLQPHLSLTMPWPQQRDCLMDSPSFSGKSASLLSPTFTTSHSCCFLPIVVFRLGCRLLGGFTLNFSRSVPLRTAELVRNGPAQGNANILFGFIEKLYLIMPDRKFMFLDQTLTDGRELLVGQSSINLCLRLLRAAGV